MRSTHVLSVEVLVGLLPIRQMLSFLNEKFLVSALVKQNELLMLKLLPSRMADCSLGIEDALSYGVRPPLGGFDICA
jgi:hypothetical protein